MKSNPIERDFLGNGSLTDGGQCEADSNADGVLNVMDVVLTVNTILGNTRAADATSIMINKSSNEVSFDANGYVGAIQMTLSHGNDFSIEITDDALVADYNTEDNKTTLIVVNPETTDLFVATGAFTVDEVLTVAEAESLLAHTDTSSAAIEFSVGITDSLSNYAGLGGTTTKLNSIVAEDKDLVATVSGTLASANDITQLNYLASKFDETGVTAKILATIETTKDKLYASGSALLSTTSTDAIGITVTDAVSPTEWAAIKATTGAEATTVTASGGFSAALDDFATTGGTTTNWNNAVAANAAKAVTVTDTTLTTANHITALNHLLGDADHTGGGSTVTATVEAALATIDPGNLNAAATDTITVTVTDALTNANIADLNTLKGKTAGKVTVNNISATAAQLATLDTVTTDSVTMTASGNEITIVTCFTDGVASSETSCPTGSGGEVNTKTSKLLVE